MQDDIKKVIDMNHSIKNLFNVDPKVASSTELDAVVNQAKKILHQAETARQRASDREAKAALNAKKAAYGPAIPIHHREYYWRAIVMHLVDTFTTNGSISNDDLKFAIGHNCHNVENKKYEVWRCPECGKLSLCVEYADNHKKQVQCCDCGWKCPKKASTEYEAWDMFEEWLKKNGWYSFTEPSIIDEHFDWEGELHRRADQS